LAIVWGEEMRRKSAGDPLPAMDAALSRLETDFGTWKMPWGEINRFQRINGDIVQPFSDAAPSIAIGFPYGIWGSLASFRTRPYPGTKK
jgi:acyl-homoserine-lactone acylase